MPSKWARERGVRLRVRRWRHSYEGFSTINGGIVIDVSAMNKVKVDRKNRVAHVQTGNSACPCIQEAVG